MTRLIQKIRTKIGQMDLLSDMWNIGFVTEDIADVVKSDKLHIHWLKHNYTDRWFADPFLLEVTEKQIIVLVEEFCYKIRKGRIARLVISRPDYVLQDMKIVLEMPYHLSFPVICQKDGETFVMPECALSGELNLYKYNPKTIMLEKVSEVGHLPLSDATIVTFKSGEKYIFSTEFPNPNGNVLQVYPFDGNAMTIQPKPVAEISFPSNIARNAGDAFYIGDDMYRPAQDCNKCYGNGINIQKVTKDGQVFSFETVSCFHSDNPDYSLGYHTLNMKNGLIVVDGHRFRYPRTVKMLQAISRLIR